MRHPSPVTTTGTVTAAVGVEAQRAGPFVELHGAGEVDAVAGDVQVAVDANRVDKHRLDYIVRKAVEFQPGSSFST